MADAKAQLKEAATKLAELCRTRGVRLPAGMDGLGKAANALNTTKTADGKFDMARTAACASFAHQLTGKQPPARCI